MIRIPPPLGPIQQLPVFVASFHRGHLAVKSPVLANSLRYYPRTHLVTIISGQQFILLVRFRPPNRVRALYAMPCPI